MGEHKCRPGSSGFLSMTWWGETEKKLVEAQMVGIDPFEQLLANSKAMSDQNVAFYREHLKILVKAYRSHRAKYDRDALLNLMVKALVESDNSREDLAYQVIVAVDELSK